MSCIPTNHNENSKVLKTDFLNSHTKQPNVWDVWDVWWKANEVHALSAAIIYPQRKFWIITPSCARPLFFLRIHSITFPNGQKQKVSKVSGNATYRFRCTIRFIIEAEGKLFSEFDEKHSVISYKRPTESFALANAKRFYSMYFTKMMKKFTSYWIQSLPPIESNAQVNVCTCVRIRA